MPVAVSRKFYNAYGFLGVVQNSGTFGIELGTLTSVIHQKFCFFLVVQNPYFWSLVIKYIVYNAIFFKFNIIAKSKMPRKGSRGGSIGPLTVDQRR